MRPRRSSQIRIPVRLIDGTLEYFYGGQVPVADGISAELLLDRIHITDEAFLEAVTKPTKHKIFEIGTELLVALTIRPESALKPALKELLIDRKNIKLSADYYKTIRSQNTCFVRVCVGQQLGEQPQLPLLTDPNAGVWLELKGLEPEAITTSPIFVPNVVSKEPLISLNHAFTKLSEAYEPWRLAHTGSIYERVLYQERNSRWYPLSVLRDAAQAKDEHALIKEQWKVIQEQLGLVV